MGTIIHVNARRTQHNTAPSSRGSSPPHLPPRALEGVGHCQGLGVSGAPLAPSMARSSAAEPPVEPLGRMGGEWAVAPSYNGLEVGKLQTA